MSEYGYTTADLAAEFGIAPKTLRKKARALGIGIDLEGRAGFRYSEEDRRRLIESMERHEWRFHRAVADWLKSVAVDVDKRDNPQRVGGRFEALRIPDEHAALTVARAYLGESA